MTNVKNCVKLEARNKKLELKCRKSKENIEHIKKCNINDDTKALIFEIADKHDHIANLRSKMNKLEEKVEQLERKVQFREKIIRELRRSTKNQQNHSPLLMTPPRTPELKTSRSSADLIENNLMYRNNNYLTVPNNLNLNIPKHGDSLYSLSDIDQDSTVGKSMSEVNFDCYDDVNKEEIERLTKCI
ncbi:hypothetical protein PVAND_006504 [Polypedilum vanderplanki]|uniref:Uncharacterized protein n=1 Tax=Polypedilum vanderplanki TaxID=319348 RepID=A0A9J6C4A1_POLVA|nr:hypothetical protein PVAND_006504 [Polypedilum vanderplanki]